MKGRNACYIDTYGNNDACFDGVLYIADVAVREISYEST